MREIKFRQAIFKDGKFHHWHYWGFCGYRGDFVAPIRIKPMGDAIDPTGYEVKESQQYPELNDKNGKEIYEGDIITPASRFSSVNYLVYWDDRVSQFRLCARNDKQFDKTHPLDWATEVIGNIYENPELLEKT